MIPVILDTDIGSDIDDIWALAMLLRCPELDLRLVTTVSGDPEYRARIAARVLTVAGRDDVPIAIGVGGMGNEYLPNEKFAADVDLTTYRGGVRRDAAAAMVECIMASPEPVTVVSIGPATNIAAALDAKPAIAGRARFVGMQGSVRVGYMGVDYADPEYNVRTDVAAFRTVSAAPWDVLITPLDTCGSVLVQGARYERLKAATDPLMSAVLDAYREWTTWAYLDWFEQRTSTLYDCVAVYLAYDTSFVDVETLPIAVDDGGVMHIVDGSPEIRIATTWKDQDAFTDHLVERLLDTTQANPPAP